MVQIVCLSRDPAWLATEKQLITVCCLRGAGYFAIWLCFGGLSGSNTGRANPISWYCIQCCVLYVFSDALQLHIILLSGLGYKVAQATGSRHVIFVVKFRPDSETKFVTCGFKHVKFWTVAGTQLIGRRGIIPKSAQTDLHTMLSLAFASVSLCGGGGEAIGALFVHYDLFLCGGGCRRFVCTCTP